MCAHALPPYVNLSAASQPPLRGFDIKADTTATQIFWAFEAFSKASKRLRSVCRNFETARSVREVFETISKRLRTPRNNFAAFANVLGATSKRLRKLRSEFGAVCKSFGALRGVSEQTVPHRCKVFKAPSLQMTDELPLVFRNYDAAFF